MRVSSKRPVFMSDLVASRAALAQAIAGLIVHDNCTWPIAREKIRQQYGIGQRASAQVMPSSEEIESAVRETFRIFQPDEHARILCTLRWAALRTMDLLRDYPVFLTGSVLNGAAGIDSTIVLEVFSDDVKAVEITLMDAYVPFEAIDPLPSRMPTPDECLGFLLPERSLGQLISVRVNVYPSHLQSRNPYRRAPDRWQLPWESQGKIAYDELKTHLTAENGVP